MSGGHDRYGKAVLELASQRMCKSGESCITRYGKSFAHIDGTVGQIAVEIESRTGKQVRGAVLDLIVHAYPKKLLILIPMHIGRHQVSECEFLLSRFLDPSDFRVVLLDGTGQNRVESDVQKVRTALVELGFESVQPVGTADPDTVMGTL